MNRVFNSKTMNKAFVFLLLIVTYFSLMYTFASLWSRMCNVDIFMASDLTVPYAMAHNLIYDHGHIMNWRLGPPPLYFPGFVFVYLSSFFVKSPYTDMFVYAVIQVAFFVSTIILLFKEVTKTKLGIRLGIISSMVYLLLWDYFHPFYLYSYYDYFTAILRNGHFASAIIVFLSLYLFLKILQQYKFYLVALFSVILILTGVSDLLTNMYFTIPMIVTITILHFFSYIDRKKYLWSLLLLVLNFIATNLIYHYVPFPIVKLTPHIEFHFIVLVDVLKTIFNGFIKHNLVMGVMWLIFVIFAPVSLIRSRKANDKDFLLFDYTFIFLLTMLAVSFGIMVLTYSGQVIPARDFHDIIPEPTRYIIPFVIGPVFIGLPLLLYKHFTGLKLLLKNMAYCNILLIIAVAALLVRPQFHPQILLHYYPKISACFDRHIKKLHLNNGISFIGEPAAMFAFYTKTNTHIALVGDGAHTNWPITWLVNLQDYQYPKYDYVITGQRHPDANLLQRFGQPTASFECKQGRLYYYIFAYQNGKMNGLSKGFVRFIKQNFKYFDLMTNPVKGKTKA